MVDRSSEEIGISTEEYVAIWSLPSSSLKNDGNDKRISLLGNAEINERSANELINPTGISGGCVFAEGLPRRVITMLCEDNGLIKTRLITANGVANDLQRL